MTAMTAMTTAISPTAITVIISNKNSYGSNDNDSQLRAISAINHQTSDSSDNDNGNANNNNNCYYYLLLLFPIYSNCNKHTTSAKTTTMTLIL